MASISSPQSINESTAKNIMSSPVQTVKENWSVKNLLDFFVTHRITGAPVIDANGAVTGVVTMTDVLRFENLPKIEKERLIGVSCYGEYAGYVLSATDISSLAEHADINCPVAQIMTPHIISVDVDASVMEIATLLREKEIHRVFVLEKNKPVGVISTSNLLDVLISACK